MTRHSYTGTQSTGDWLMGAVKSNPEGLLLLAAGCALLLRSGASKVSAQASGQRSASSVGGSQQYNQGNHGQRPAGSGISESISQAADSAREYAADVGKTVSDKAGAYASTVGEYADDAWRQSERLAGQASRTVQQTVSRVLQEQPLALAVAGLAAGAAVAAAFPSTAVERRTLGSAGERLSEAASSAGQQLSQAASKAGEKLMSVADERGLNTDGLKEVASDVAEAFTGAFGDQNSRGGQSTGSGSPGQSSPGSSQPGGTSASSGQGGQSTRPGSSSTGTNYGQPSSGAPLPGGASKPGTTRQS